MNRSDIIRIMKRLAPLDPLDDYITGQLSDVEREAMDDLIRGDAELERFVADRREDLQWFERGMPKGLEALLKTPEPVDLRERSDAVLREFRSAIHALVDAISRSMDSMGHPWEQDLAGGFRSVGQATVSLEFDAIDPPGKLELSVTCASIDSDGRLEIEGTINQGGLSQREGDYRLLLELAIGGRRLLLPPIQVGETGEISLVMNLQPRGDRREDVFPAVNLIPSTCFSGRVI